MRKCIVKTEPSSVFLWWKVLIFFIFIFTSISIFVKYIFWSKIAKLFRIIKDGIFSPVYSFFLNEKWPIVAETRQVTNSTLRLETKESILNLAYPDENITYYVASFSSKDRVLLEGNIPDTNQMYFWSLTIYEDDGSIFDSINDTKLPGRYYSIEISSSQKKERNDTILITPPTCNTYCVIQRVYKKDIKFQLIPDYVPEISVNNGRVKVKNVDDNDRIRNSNTLQSIFSYLFRKKFQKINIETFFNVNVNNFFLPAASEMSLVFPNPFAKYLMVFPSNSNVIKVEGKLQESIGIQNNNCRYVSFMASSFYTTSTDNSISYYNLKVDSNNEYLLFVAFSQKEAEENGYDNTIANHNLLLWNKTTNEKPVLVYRLVSTAKEHNKDDMLFSLDNKTNNISNLEIEKKYIYAPKVISS